MTAESNTPRRTGRGVEEYSNKCNPQFDEEKTIFGLPPNQAPFAPYPVELLTIDQRRVTNLAAWELCPSELDLEDTPFTILQQLQAAGHPHLKAAGRIRVMYDASAHLDREIQRHGKKNAWNLNFEAAQALCHGFELFPCEAFQLQWLEFNSRHQAPLSELDLWKVIRAADNAGSLLDRGWLKLPVDQKGPLAPKPPLWFAGMNESQFWIPNPGRSDAWKRKVVREAPTFPANLIDWILWKRRQREVEALQGGPPLQDHPFAMGEIGSAVGLSAHEVEDHFFKLVCCNLITTMDFGHIPGVYTSVLVPNAFD